jgi:hypothetical protein
VLRQQKSRLEARMAILEDHNRQLEAQLDRLRQLVVSEGSTATTNGTLQSRYALFLYLGPRGVFSKILFTLSVSDNTGTLASNGTAIDR